MAKPPPVIDVSSPPPPSDRSRATRIRAKIRVHAPVDPDDLAWFNDYERAREAAAQGSKGASRRKVTEFREEESMAIGTGTAAEAAAAAASSREEGRRLDYLVDRSVAAMSKACDLHVAMCEMMLKRAQEDGEVVRSLMVAFRENYLEKTELEADAILKQAEAEAEAQGGDGLNKLAEMLLPMLMQRAGLPAGPGKPTHRPRRQGKPPGPPPAGA